MTPDPIHRYLADLDRRLRGRPNRDRLVAEAEDHLRESQAARIAAGLDADRAAHEAVARMGPAPGVGGSRSGR